MDDPVNDDFFFAREISPYRIVNDVLRALPPFTNMGEMKRAKALADILTRHACRSKGRAGDHFRAPDHDRVVDRNLPGPE